MAQILTRRIGPGLLTAYGVGVMAGAGIYVLAGEAIFVARGLNLPWLGTLVGLAIVAAGHVAAGLPPL